MAKKPTYEELEQRVGELEKVVEEHESAGNALRKSEYQYRDITDRKRAEEKLKENGQFLQDVFEAIQNGISVLDTDLNVIRTNRWMEKMYASQMPIVGRKCYQVYQERQSPCPWCPSLQTIKTGETHTEIVPYPSEENPTGWIELSAFPIKDEEGRVTSVIEYVKDITERKQAEQALHESEQNFRDLVENLLDGVAIVDENTYHLYVNSKFSEITGYSKDELLNMTGWDFTRPEDAIEFKQRMKNRMAGQQHKKAYERIILKKDGTQVPVEMSTTVTKWQGKKRPMAIIRDITERKQAEEALRLSEYELSIRNRINEILLTITDDGMYGEVLKIILDVMKSEYGVFGYLDENGDAVFPTMTRYIWDKCQVADKRIVFPRETWGDSAWVRAINEKRTIYSNQPSSNIPRGHIGITRHISLPLIHRGEVVGLMQVANKDTDYTERDIELFETIGSIVAPILGARLQRDWKESARKRLSAAIEQAAEVVVITDPQGTIQYVNPAFESVTGYARAEAIGQNPRFLKSGKHDEHYYKKLWDTISGGDTWQGQMINRHKDESLFTEESTISPVFNATGNIVHYVAVKRDITKEQELKQQYQQAQKVEAIGRLAGGVAHDLNNLLSPILGYGEMLMDDFGPDDARREFVDQIVRAGFRARDLVRQLLAFSRKQTLEYKTLDVNKTIEGFEKLLRRTIREDIEIEIIPSSDIRSVRADVGQIEQVIMNLAINAQEATSEGGKLTIETASADFDEDYAATHQGVEPGEYAMLAISDTGCGMDDETRKHILEPFFSTKGEQGTGLGLATVYGIVKQHGGNIWVYSEPGKGTTFKVYLPVTEESLVENKSGEKTAADLKGSETILLVEDNEQVRVLGHTILKRQGYTVLLAENGSEALATIETHDGPVHLLLTDVVMPEMDGRELFTKVVEKNPGLKVLYMSGYTNNVIAHRGILEEGIAFIQKPFTVQGLAAGVREVLEQE